VIVTPTTSATTTPQLAAPTTTTVPDGEVILGEIDTSGEAPDGVDLSAFPDAPAGPTPTGDGPQLSAGMTCFNQCIKSGVMYPRGFGALLVIETHVEARLFVAVVEDLDSDGGEDGITYANSTISNGRVTHFSWALDHLQPGQTYDVQVTATDENGDMAEAYGQFTTLSERTITLWIGDPVLHGGPTNIVNTWVALKVADLNWRWAPPSTEDVYYSLPRYLDLAVAVYGIWEHSQYTDCASFDAEPISTYGNSDAHCGTWNTRWLNDVDTDAIPVGRVHWTDVEISPPVSTGNGVPPPGEGPRYLDFSIVLTLTVEYS
jgi:hypothetical protein